MTPPDIGITAGFTAVGALLGALIALHFFKRGGGARPKVVVGMTEAAHIDPATVGVQVEMKVGTINVRNLVLLEVTVKNRGPRDVVVRDPADPGQHPLRPRIELPPNYRALADPWNPDGASPRGDVRLARRLQGQQQELHVHIHRLAVGSTVRARVLCTHRGASSVPPLNREDVRFYPGFLPDVEVQPTELLGEPPALLSE